MDNWAEPDKVFLQLITAGISFITLCLQIPLGYLVYHFYTVEKRRNKILKDCKQLTVFSVPDKRKPKKKSKVIPGGGDKKENERIPEEECKVKINQSHAKADEYEIPIPSNTTVADIREEGGQESGEGENKVRKDVTNASTQASKGPNQVHTYEEIDKVRKPRIPSKPKCPPAKVVIANETKCHEGIYEDMTRATNIGKSKLTEPATYEEVDRVVNINRSRRPPGAYQDIDEVEQPYVNSATIKKGRICNHSEMCKRDI